MQAPKLDTRPARQRRAHARFDAALTVEYDYDAQRVASQLQSLSAGGMLLKTTVLLASNTDLDFSIELPDAPREPLRVRGRVLRVSSRGAHVQFHPGQIQASLRIRRFAVGKIIPDLSNEVTKPGVSARQIIQLAELLIDFGRVEDAMRLFRAKLSGCRGDRAFCENMAVLWLEQLVAASTVSRRQTLMDELKILCERADGHAGSVVLLAARERAFGVRLKGPPPPAPQGVHASTPNRGATDDALLEQMSDLLQEALPSESQATMQKSVVQLAARITQLETELAACKQELRRKRLLIAAKSDYDTKTDAELPHPPLPH